MTNLTAQEPMLGGRTSNCIENMLEELLIELIIASDELYPGIYWPTGGAIPPARDEEIALWGQAVGIIKAVGILYRKFPFLLEEYLQSGNLNSRVTTAIKASRIKRGIKPFPE